MHTIKESNNFFQIQLFYAPFIFITIVLLSGCTSIPKCSGDSPAEQATHKEYDGFKVNAISKLIDTRIKFHDAALDNLAYNSKFPFYLLGFEKPRKNTETPYPLSLTNEVKGIPSFDISNLNASKDDQEDIKATLDDPRSLVLTHILNTSENCFIFNVYNKTSSEWCQKRHTVDINEDLNYWSSEGWKGLDSLGKEIKLAAQRENATHIILLATGWNTVEYESFLDFSYWMKIIAEDFKDKEFRPIFIGIAWESAWSSSIWAKLPFGSWSTKGNDADAIGFTWVNYLLNDILKPIAFDSNTQLVAIGHSFGSRIVLGAHYARDIIIRKQLKSDSMPITLIGIQAAFPTGRFTLTEGWEHEYASNNKGNANVVITTSTKDKATGTIGFGTGYIGGAGGIDELTNNESIYSKFVTPVLNTDKNGQPQTKPQSELVTVYDATPFVACELEGTSSGAHSDVYDQEMGHFLGETIRAYDNSTTN